MTTTIHTTIEPHRAIDVGDAELTDLTRRGLVIENTRATTPEGLLKAALRQRGIDEPSPPPVRATPATAAAPAKKTASPRRRRPAKTAAPPAPPEEVTAPPPPPPDPNPPEDVALSGQSEEH